MPGRRHAEIAYEDAAPGAACVSNSPALKTPNIPSPTGRPTVGPPDGLVVPLADVGVLPEPADNCAILRRRLDAGTKVKLFDGTLATVAATVLEGHRLAVVPIPRGAHLLSWGLPFGAASRDIAPGEYVCNESVLVTLRLRHIECLPSEGNFEDVIVPHVIDEAKFAPTPQVPVLPPQQRLTFMGYDRAGAQGGVGTRNFLAVVPTSALSSPFARRLADALQPATKGLRNCDGVVPLAHTEAAIEADGQKPNNWELLVRTLAGFVSHPNVGAALVVGYRGELLTPAVLRSHMEAAGRPLPKWCHFLELAGESYEEDVVAGRDVVLPWLPELDRCVRTPQPLSELRVALQCGGSDAFSGVSGNPAAGWAAKVLIEHGGAAVLAETDELIGAESYILSRVADLATGQKFLRFVERFKERFSWHGQNAESNPSGGNKLRGLYNIALKSIGAAKKKHVEVALDGVLEYSERLPEGQRGYYFMDSPGNDLESIAGQVASGCNAIFFITGNGSITNFPFVPTLKIITTSERHRLLERDMDFNAGIFQDEGVSMSSLGVELFADLVRMASGEHFAGERAGHSQVSIWREWVRACAPDDAATLEVGEREGAPLALGARDGEAQAEAELVRSAAIAGRERLGLVLPTSLCSGEVARMVAAELEACRAEGSRAGAAALAAAVDRFVALPHTEGCGVGYAGDGEKIFSRVMFGHLMHANVSMALLLEHGCEKTHNAWMKDELSHHGVDVQRFGFASVQLDGGIERSSARVREWFISEAAKSVQSTAQVPTPVPLFQLPLALLADVKGGSAASLAVALMRAYVGAKGIVLVPGSSPLLKTAAFLDELCGNRGGVEPSLAFAQPAATAGAHVMHVPAGVVNRVEIITGLVAAGAGVVVVISASAAAKAVPVVGHPFVPVLHIHVDEACAEDATAERTSQRTRHDLRLVRRRGEEDSARERRWLRAVIGLIVGAASQGVRPVAAEVVGFQVARGPSGVSA